MTQSNLERAVAYYTAMGQKDVDAAGQYLHPDVDFIAPLAKLKGKDHVVMAARGFVAFFTSLTIRAQFEKGDEVMLVYDLALPIPVGVLSAAALFTFKDGLITRLELFYDARMIAPA